MDFGITLHGLLIGEPRTFETITEAALRLRAETGMNAVEIWMDCVSGRPCDFWPEQYDDRLIEQMSAFLSHFDCFGVHLPFASSDYACGNPVVSAAAAGQIALGVDVSAALGARYVVGHARHPIIGLSGDDEQLRRYAEVLRPLCDRAAAAGILYCLETCEFLGSSQRMLGMVAAVAHPAFRLCLDSGKMMMYLSRQWLDVPGDRWAEGDWADASPNMLAWLEQHGHLIGSTHLWDYQIKPGEGGRILPGNGLCDVRGVVRRLVACGYPGSYNLETAGTYEQERTAVLTLKQYLLEARRSEGAR